MELNRDQIIKALGCCVTGYCYQGGCPCCEVSGDDDICKCTSELATHALALIKQLIGEKYDIECSYNSLKKDNERLHASCTEFERKCASLTEESERLKAADVVEVVRCKECAHYVDIDSFVYDGKKAKHCVWHSDLRYDNEYCSDGIRSEK